MADILIKNYIAGIRLYPMKMEKVPERYLKALKEHEKVNLDFSGINYVITAF